MNATVERLSWNEIRDRYPNQWVLLSDPEMDGEDVRSAAVAHHGHEWLILIEDSAEVRSRDLALLFTGERQVPDLNFVL